MVARISLTALREFMLSPNSDQLKADGIVACFDRQTGQIVTGMTSEDQEAFDDDEDRYVRMPEESTDGAWQIRCEFAESLQDGQHGQQRLQALQGKRAFLHFDQVLGQLGLRRAWEDYRSTRREEQALEWCQENGTDVVDDANGGKRV